MCFKNCAQCQGVRVYHGKFNFGTGFIGIRRLKRLVAIELKLGDFKAEYKGQMELYLRWLDKYERCPGEEQPMGLILCAGKKDERIELLELDRSGIHVAEHLTELPSKKILQEKLHNAVKRARKRLELQSESERKNAKSPR
ncbi:MAG: DUF1016 domain-containing protein [Chlamydiales bacterium]|jgi:hypothetical protein|nr:DUF1016 domain-containing protein [Chlamydiales bacterium]